MRLTDKSIKAAKPQSKLYRIFDGKGLYLEVHPSGAKYWRMKIRFNGREDRLAFGVYPEVSLADARLKCQRARETLDLGKNPRHTDTQGNDLTFEAGAIKWFEARKGGWSPDYAATVWHRLEADLFPSLGPMMMSRIGNQDVLRVIQVIDKRGAPVKAKRVLNYVNAIFTFAILTGGEMRYAPTLSLRDAISTRPVKHNPYLKEAELPEFLKRLDEYSGNRIVVLATKFLLLTMTRTCETRFATFDEIDWKTGIWKLSEERMKMSRQHWIPLSRQALAILDEAKEFGGGYIFPSPIRKGRALSENAMLYAIYDLGYRGKLTGHGFRATASTILNERGYNSLAIERQLAHVDSNSVRASYNHAEFLNERRVMLQDWADLLDSLRNS